MPIEKNRQHKSLDEQHSVNNLVNVAQRECKDQVRDKNKELCGNDV
jgi:hypothetical protein